MFGHVNEVKVLWVQCYRAAVSGAMAQAICAGDPYVSCESCGGDVLSKCGVHCWAVGAAAAGERVVRAACVGADEQMSARAEGGRVHGGTSVGQRPARWWEGFFVRLALGYSSVLHLR